ncbi:MAG TPA: hypothetical protein VHE79_01060, partial [Spirochaetia bacterium]
PYIFLQARVAPTILEAMGELKSCLFCGRNVEISFQYCPHCGYEFGPGEDIPVLPEADVAEPSPVSEEDYLVRLRTLQEILSDMERELDLIIRTSSRDP